MVEPDGGGDGPGWDGRPEWDGEPGQPGGEPGRKGRAKGSGGMRAAPAAVAVFAVAAILVAVFAVFAGGEGTDEREDPGLAPEAEAGAEDNGGQSAVDSEPAEHRILFETSGGSACEAVTAADGDMVTSPADPVKGDAAFEGWYADRGLTSPVFFPYEVNAADPETIVFYAKWATLGNVPSNDIPTGNGYPYFPECKASSQLPGDDKTPDYGPSMVRDGKLDTAWNEGAPNDGTGEWLQLEAMSRQHVSGLRIATGFQKNEEIYAQNRRPKDITISFEDGTRYEATLADVFGQYQTISFTEPVDTRIVRITINSTYQGKYFDDCCIAEIEEF